MSPWCGYRELNLGHIRTVHILSSLALSSAPRIQVLLFTLLGIENTNYLWHSIATKKSLGLKWESIALQTKVLALLCEDRMQTIKVGFYILSL